MPPVVTTPLLGGIDRSLASIHSDKRTFWDLVGFRQSQTQRGLIEQLPYFYLAAQPARGTYYNAGSQTEPADTAFLGMLTARAGFAVTAFYLTQYCATTTGNVQIPVLLQSAPANAALTTSCYLVVNTLTVNLGSSLDVVIDGATTFKWRVNGGAYTTTVPITTAGVSLGGNYTIYFLATSGFNVNDTWSWSRTDAVQPSPYAGSRQTQSAQYGNELFFLAPDRRVLVYQLTAGVIVSAGYRPIYGSYLTFYNDHLVLGNYGTSVSDLATVAAYTRVGWSDRTDVHNFFATDVNEADTKNLPHVDSTSLFGHQILGVFVASKQLFVLTNQALYSTFDLGLPIVFSFDVLTNIGLSLSGLNLFPVVKAQGGVYIISEQDLFFFNGASLESRGATVRGLFVTEDAPSALSTLFAHYDSSRHELHWYRADEYLYTYQELTGTCFRRHASFIDTVYSLSSSPTFPRFLVGTGNRKGLEEDIALNQTPLADATSGVAFGTRSFTLQAMSEPLIENTKTQESEYLSARVTTAGSGYSTGVNLQAKAYWYESAIGVPSTGVTHASAVWTSASPDGRISFPRVPYKTLNLQLTLVGLDGAKPPARLTVVAFGANIPSTEAKR